MVAERRIPEMIKALEQIREGVQLPKLRHRTTFGNPNVNPASTDFGRITSATAASPRFIQFVSKFTF